MTAVFGADLLNPKSVPIDIFKIRLIPGAEYALDHEAEKILSLRTI
jgi:hypothetical protein